MEKSEIPIENRPFDAVSVEAVINALSTGLAGNFTTVSVTEQDCPDLTAEPYLLAKAGICGRPTIVDIGGVSYLTPVPNFDKYYDLREVSNWVGIPEGLAIGSGAGPWKYVGTNSELMANFAFGPSNIEKMSSWIAKIDVSTGQHVVEQLPADAVNSGMLLNLLCTEGNLGKVIKVVCEGRKGDQNFVTCMRNSLATQFPGKFIGMGGAFQIKSGKANLHVMPDFSEVPLPTDEDVNNWLKFFEVPSPLTCLSVFVSMDPGLDLRVEHTHCFSTHGDGGHYHYDTTPDDVVYEGYFVLADALCRVDRPLQK